MRKKKIDLVMLDPRQKSSDIHGPRGVAPKILIEQVRNTAPFLFLFSKETLAASGVSYIKNIVDTDEMLQRSDLTQLPHLEYFKLCLSAHYSTVATFVPTDVDNQIRSRLWGPSVPLETLEAMADLVLESRNWDTQLVSTRWISSRKTPSIQLGGHDGEWLSTAAGAYGALRKRSPDKAAEIAAAIIWELQKSADLFKEFRDCKDGVSLLISSALIAHNMGDLDRVLDMWNVENSDPLKQAVYKVAHIPSTIEEPSAPKKSLFPAHSARFGGQLLAAGHLNKTMMALENHRHFALRRARPLRNSTDFLIGIGPFFDEWGARVASHPSLSGEEKGLIAETLINGFEFLASKSGPTPVGYARALTGMIERFPGGLQSLSSNLPAKLARTLKAGPLRTYCVIPKARFEEQMAQAALRFLDKF
jgi:hypothetical protein